ncbi:MAG: hypothetical protein WAO76_05260 [Georgfuchsia sp.]
MASNRSLGLPKDIPHKNPGVHLLQPSPPLVITAVPQLLVYTHDIVSLKFIWHGAISGASDHGGHVVTLLDKIFCTDWVIEPLTKDNIAKFDTVAGRVRCHTESVRKLASRQGIIIVGLL